MQETNKTRIVIESTSEIEKQDMHHLLTLFFRNQGIAVKNPQEYGKGSLQIMSLMFQHTIQQGGLEIELAQDRPYPLRFDPHQKVSVEVSGVSKEINERISKLIRQTLATSGLIVMDQPVEPDADPVIVVDVSEKQITYRTDAG